MGRSPSASHKLIKGGYTSLSGMAAACCMYFLSEWRQPFSLSRREAQRSRRTALRAANNEPVTAASAAPPAHPPISSTDSEASLVVTLRQERCVWGRCRTDG